MNTIDVGNFISKLRKEKGLTQKELAERIGVTDKAVSKWETGKCYPDIEIVEKLSLLFNISINEILSGEKILPEKIQQEADKTIVQAMKTSKKEKHKGQIIALILSIITLISGCFAVYQAIKTPKNEHFSLEMYSRNSSAVFNELSSSIYKEFHISTNTVCTNSYVRYDNKGEVTYIDMTLWDNENFKEVTIKYWINSENNKAETSVTMYQKNENQNIDGIHFNKYINFLATVDLGRIVEMSGNTTAYGYSIDNDSSYMCKTIEENADYEILPDNYNYLYKNGQVVPFTSANQIEGKVFEIAVVTNIEEDTVDSLHSSCALIYIPR